MGKYGSLSVFPSVRLFHSDHRRFDPIRVLWFLSSSQQILPNNTRFYLIIFLKKFYNPGIFGLDENYFLIKKCLLMRDNLSVTFSKIQNIQSTTVMFWPFHPESKL